jgi:hypothetical protein
MPKIHKAIADIMSEVGAIKKDRTNTGQGYKFRGIDDVYLAVHDLFVKHGVFSVPTVQEERTEERQTKGGSALIYRVLRVKYEFFARDGSSIVATVIGEGMDSGDKASNKAMSVAHKYAILQLLAIPTEDTVDPETDSHEVATKQPREAPPERTRSPAPTPGFPAFVALINSAVPNAERVGWMQRAQGGKDIALLEDLAVEIRDKYGKEKTE